MTQYLIVRLKKLKLNDILLSIRNNWFIPISAFFFFLLNTGLFPFNNWSMNSYFSFIPATVAVIILSFVCHPFSSFQSHVSFKVSAIALISSIGICFNTWIDFKTVQFFWGGDPLYQRLVFMILSIPFVYVLNLLFWEKMRMLLKEIFNEANIGKVEITVYLSLFLLFSVFVSFCFLRSQAFYGTEYYYDIIYTSDAPLLLKTNAFIIIDHIENDIRQPMFAVFAAPLMGIPCLLGRLIPGIPMALFVALFQLVLLWFALFLFAQELKLNQLQRTCFILLSSVTYTYILFSIMIDQYVISFFWLALTIYLMNGDKKEAEYTSLAASGTLLVSGALVPFIFLPPKMNLKSLFVWIKGMLFYIIDFVLLMILSDRFHVLWNAIDNLRFLSNFTGKTIGFTERVLQYLNFAGSYFFVPESLVKTVENKYKGWQLADITNINFIGIIVVVMTIMCFIVTRKSKISQIAFAWFCLSIVVLMGVGWGIHENGLILYTLYFGWPFILLFFNFLTTLENKMKTKWLTPAVSVVLGVMMLICNIPEIIRLVEFAFSEYPA